MRWLILVLLCVLPALANRQDYVRAEVVALRDTLWTLGEAADRGDVPTTEGLVAQAWEQWLDIDDALRREIKYAYPRIERQMDQLEAEALGRAHQVTQVPNPPVEMPTRVSLRYPGYSDPWDLFGNSGLGKL